MDILGARIKNDEGNFRVIIFLEVIAVDWILAIAIFAIFVLVSFRFFRPYVNLPTDDFIDFVYLFTHDEALAHRYARMILDLCERYDEDPLFIAAIIAKESSFNEFVVEDYGYDLFCKKLGIKGRYMSIGLGQIKTEKSMDGWSTFDLIVENMKDEIDFGDLIYESRRDEEVIKTIRGDKTSKLFDPETNIKLIIGYVKFIRRLKGKDLKSEEIYFYYNYGHNRKFNPNAESVKNFLYYYNLVRNFVGAGE